MKITREREEKLIVSAWYEMVSTICYSTDSESLYSSQVTHPAGPDPDFHSTKRLGAPQTPPAPNPPPPPPPPPPDRMPVHCKVTSAFYQAFLRFRLYLCKLLGGRGTVGVSPLTPMSDQDRISPYIINTISTR